MDNKNRELLDSPTVREAFKELCGGGRSVVVLVWDEGKSKPVLATNAGPMQTIHALIKTLDAITEGRGDVEGMNIHENPTPTH